MPGGEQEDAGGHPHDQRAHAWNEGEDRGRRAEERRLRDAGYPVADRRERALREPGEHGAEERGATHALELVEDGAGVARPDREHLFGAERDGLPASKNEGQRHHREEEHQENVERRRGHGGGDRRGARGEIGGGVAELGGDLVGLKMQGSEVRREPEPARAEAALGAERGDQDLPHRRSAGDEERGEPAERGEEGNTGDHHAAERDEPVASVALDQALVIGLQRERDQRAEENADADRLDDPDDGHDRHDGEDAEGPSLGADRVERGRLALLHGIVGHGEPARIVVERVVGHGGGTIGEKWKGGPRSA